MLHAQVLIVGAGPVGLALALALQRHGICAELADMRTAAAIIQDPRTLALSQGSQLTLERLHAWSTLPHTPIHTVHVSQQHGFGRTLIHAAEEGVPALGYVSRAGAVAQRLRERADALNIPIREHTTVTSVQRHHDQMQALFMQADGNTYSKTYTLVAFAEGNLSAGEAVVEKSYQQQALIGFFELDTPHQNIAYERFTPSGPLALLPFENRYAFVHTVPPNDVAAWQALSATAYVSKIQHIIGQRVQLKDVDERLCYPLSLRYRQNTTAAGRVWLGNAAQTLHPVAGQGFNLALRDVWTLADTLAEHQQHFGDPETLDRYQKRRYLDRRATMTFTDQLVHLFSRTPGVISHLAGAGLFALDILPPARSFVARRLMFGDRR